MRTMPKMFRKNSRLLSKKMVAGSLCLCLLTMDVAQAAPPLSHAKRKAESALSAAKTHSVTAASRSAGGIQLAASLGSVEEFYIPPQSVTDDSRPKTVFFIQDAHDSLEAQENIAKIIHFLVARHGVKTVFEEGFEGPVPTEKYFGFIKDPVVKQKVAHALMDQLLLGGAEYAHITRFNPVVGRVSSVGTHSKPTTQDSRLDFQLIGADNVQTHLENIEWYRRSTQTRAEADADLKDLSTPIRQLAERYFPKELKGWMKLRKRFDAGELDLLEYLKRLVAVRFAGAGSQPAPALDTDGRVMPLRSMRRDLALGRPHEAAVGSLNPPLPSNAYPNILTILRAERAASVQANHAALLGRPSQELNPSKLFAEIELFENNLAEFFLTDERSRTLFHYDKVLEQLKRLSALEIKFDEYLAIRNTLATFKTEELLTFVVGVTHKSLALSKRWEKNICRAMRFYELAGQRDQAVEATLQKYSQSEPAVLVFGGFHKQNIETILRKNHFSYYVIAPKISKPEPGHKDLYRKRMASGVPGYHMPVSLHIATRYAPIFETAEFLGQREQAESLIVEEVRRVNARAEMPRGERSRETSRAASGTMRSEMRVTQGVQIKPEKNTQAVLAELSNDRRFQVVETDQAQYVIYHRGGLSREKIPEAVYVKVDAIAATQPVAKSQRLPKWLNAKNHPWFLQDKPGENQKSFFAIGLAPDTSHGRYFRRVWEQALTWAVLPVALGLLFHFVAVNFYRGLVLTLLSVVSLGPVYAPVKFKTVLSQWAMLNFFTPVRGLKNAAAAHKLEDFVAPRLRKKLGRKPVILVDAGGVAYGPLAAYLKSVRLRQRTFVFHRLFGFLFTLRWAAIHQAGEISWKRMGADDLALPAAAETSRPYFYHVYSFKYSFRPSKAMRVKPHSKKSKTAEAEEVKALLPLIHWIPKSHRDQGVLTLHGVLKNFKPVYKNLSALETKLAKARPASRDAMIRWLALLHEWIRQVRGGTAALQFDPAFYEENQHVLAQFLTGAMPLEQARDEMVKAAQQVIGLPRAALVLQGPFTYFLEQYRQSFTERIMMPLQAAASATVLAPQPSSRLNAFLQSDAGRLPVSTFFWVLLGAFIHGATLGAVFGFLVAYIFRPLYDRMQVSVRGSGWSSIKPQRLLEIGALSDWDDIRLAYDEVMARILGGETFSSEISLYVLSAILKKSGAYPALEALVRDMQDLLSKGKDLSERKFWEAAQQKRISRGIAIEDPGFLLLSELLGLPGKRPEGEHAFEKPKAALLASGIFLTTLLRDLNNPSEKKQTGTEPAERPTFSAEGRLLLWTMLRSAGWQDEDLPGFKAAPQNPKTVAETGTKKTGAFISVPAILGKLYRALGDLKLAVTMTLFLSLPGLIYVGLRALQLRNTARRVAAFVRKKAIHFNYQALAYMLFKERVPQRSWTESNPIFKTAQEEKMEEEIFNYLRGLNIPEIQPLIDEARRSLHFKFELYRDRTWYPFPASRLVKEGSAFWPGRRTQLDLNSRTLVLNAKWPVFLKAIVFLHLVPFVFQHRVIAGQQKNMHLLGESFMAVRKKILWAIGKKLLKEDMGNFFNRPDNYTTPPFAHLLHILPAYLNTVVYSDPQNPGVLYQKTYDLTIRGLRKAQEGFTIGAYDLIGRVSKRALLVPTDQPVYPVMIPAGKMTWLGKGVSFFKPFWPAVKYLSGAMVYLVGFVGIFGGIFLSLDLSFLEPLWSFMRDVLSSLPWVGDFFAALFHAITTVYYFLKHVAGVLLSWVGVDWASLRAFFKNLWQQLYPVREWIRMVLIPFIYQWAIPVLLFGIGMVNGFLVYKFNLRKQMQRAADFLFTGAIQLVALVPSLLQLGVEMLLAGALDLTGTGNSRDALAAWIESTRPVRFFRQKILPWAVNIFYAVLSVATIIFYVLPLAMMAYPPLEFQMVFHLIHSIGFPLPPIVAVYAIAVLIGVPYSYFYLLHGRLSRRPFFNGAPARTRKLFLSMMSLVGFVTVIFPVTSAWFYKSNPMGLERISYEKDTYIDLSRWYLRELYRGVGDYMLTDDKRLTDMVQKELEANLEKTAKVSPGPLGREVAEEFKKELLRSGKGNAAAVIHGLVGRLLPEDFKGYEDVVHPRTGFPVNAAEIKPHAAEILKKLKAHERSIYGNSFFFSDLLNHSASPVHDLFQNFGEEGTRAVTGHLLDILEGKVAYPSYPETYNAQREALRAIRQIYFYGFGYNRGWFLPVTEADRENFKEHTLNKPKNQAPSVLMFHPSGTFFLRAAQWNKAARKFMTDLTQRFLSVRSSDGDLALYLRGNQKTLKSTLQVTQFFADDVAVERNRQAAREFWQGALEQPEVLTGMTRELADFVSRDFEQADLSVLGRTMRLDLHAFVSSVLDGSKDEHAGEKLMAVYLKTFREDAASLAATRRLVLDQVSYLALSDPGAMLSSIEQVIELSKVRQNHYLEKHFTGIDSDVEATEQKARFAILTGEALKRVYDSASLEKRKESMEYWLNLLLSHEAMAYSQLGLMKSLLEDFNLQIKTQGSPTDRQKQLQERVDTFLKTMPLSKPVSRSEIREQRHDISRDGTRRARSRVPAAQIGQRTRQSFSPKRAVPDATQTELPPGLDPGEMRRIAGYLSLINNKFILNEQIGLSASGDSQELARSEVRTIVRSGEWLAIRQELKKRIAFSGASELDRFMTEMAALQNDLIQAGYQDVDALLLHFAQQLGRPLWKARMTLTGYRVDKRSEASAFKLLAEFRKIMLVEKRLPQKLDWADVAWDPVSLDDLAPERFGEAPELSDWTSLHPAPAKSLLWESAGSELMRLGFAPLKFGKPDELIKQGEGAVTLAIIHPANHNDIVKIREGAKHANVNVLLVLPENVQSGLSSDGREVFGANAAIVFKGDQALLGAV